MHFNPVNLFTLLWEVSVTLTMYLYIYMYFLIPAQLEKVLYALNAEKHSNLLRTCLFNSSCDSEFHIHGAICMIVRHK